MSGIENFQDDAQRIETEIERMGIALQIDWSDENQVRALAREALDHAAAEIKFAPATTKINARKQEPNSSGLPR